MHNLKPSLAYFLIVLGQLCLNLDLEINCTVDLSLQLSAALSIVGVVVLCFRR